MTCIEEIAKDAKLIENDNQLLVLIKRQVDTELMLEKKFRYLCEKVSNFVEESENVVKEVERLSCKDVANKTICLFRREQKRELHKMMRLQLMVNTFNDAFHWLEGLNRDLKHYRLNIEDNENLIMTSLDIPHGLHRGRKFLESFGGPCNDPVLLLMEIPHMLHLEWKFFKSGGRLLLVCRDDIGFINFTINEMMKGSFVWSVRYLVNIEQLIHLLREGWSIRTSVWSICLGEREDDAFVVINLSRKVSPSSSLRSVRVAWPEPDANEVVQNRKFI
nr:hypothetical protein [Tanacetum cinerariifolium]